MSKEHEALKLALEVIEAWDRGANASDYWRDRFDAITAIREALADQPAPKWQGARFDSALHEQPEGWCPPHVPLYASPQPSKPWVSLTEEEVKHEWIVWRASAPRYVGFAKGIEAKLKERNT